MRFSLAEYRPFPNWQVRLSAPHTTRRHSTIKPEPSWMIHGLAFAKHHPSRQTCEGNSPMFAGTAKYCTKKFELAGTFCDSALAECQSLFDRQAKLLDILVPREYCTTIIEPTGMFCGLALPNTGHAFRPVSETPRCSRLA